MMKKVMRYGTLIPIVLAFLSLGFIFSCALSPVQQEVGLVTLNFGPANSSKQSGTSDPVALPAFSSISVKVLGTGIPEKEYSPAQFSAPLVITVPAGINRSIMIKAIPAPSGTAPSLAKSYSGLAVFDLAIGETKNIPIKLAVSETKIYLLDQRNGNL
ncbi:hypothetical protein MASR2M78_21160 [Treponema sp.]